MQKIANILLWLPRQIRRFIKWRLTSPLLQKLREYDRRFSYSLVYNCCKILAIIAIIISIFFIALPRTAFVYYSSDEVDNFALKANDLSLFGYKEGDTIHSDDTLEFEVLCKTARINGVEYEVENQRFVLIITPSHNTKTKQYIRFYGVSVNQEFYNSQFSDMDFFDVREHGLLDKTEYENAFSPSPSTMTFEKKSEQSNAMIMLNYTNYSTVISVPSKSYNVSMKYYSSVFIALDEGYSATASINGEMVEVDKKNTISGLIFIGNSFPDFHDITLHLSDNASVDISPNGDLQDITINNMYEYQGLADGTIEFYTSPKSQTYLTKHLVTKFISDSNDLTAKLEIRSNNSERRTVLRPVSFEGSTQFTLSGNVNKAFLSKFSLFPHFLGWLKDNNLTIVPLTLISTIFGGAMNLKNKKEDEKSEK